MKELLVQIYLRSGKTLEDLKIEHGVEHSKTNGKICLNYDQVEAKEADQLAGECRALILREDNYDIVSSAFPRFFNYGSFYCAKIDWESVQFIEKLDGSIISIYYCPFKNKWQAATRSRAEADKLVQDYNFSYSVLVDTAIGSDLNSFINLAINNNSISEDEWKKRTFIFEICSPYNKIVCSYDTTKLYLIGVRNNSTLDEEMPDDWAKYLKVEIPKTYDIKNIPDMLSLVKSWKPTEHEGIVCRDKNFNRIKIKNPSYMAYNHIRDHLQKTSWRGCMEIVLFEKEDDIIPIMTDHIAKKLIRTKEIVRELFIQTEKDYNDLKDIDDMKAFALEATKRIWSAPLFAMKRKKVKNIKEFIFGTDNTVNELPHSVLDAIISLCEKVDPNYKNI